MSDRVAAGKLVSLTYSIQEVREPSAAHLRADADDGDADAGTLH